VLPGVDLSTQPQTGLGVRRRHALLAVVIVFAWMTFGFNTVLFVAGLQSVPKELLEAAQLDGPTPGSGSATSPCRCCARPPSSSP
jgi:ABC-type sugar transport system permease subunit